jgi:hypothetical protein
MLSNFAVHRGKSANNKTSVKINDYSFAIIFYYEVEPKVSQLSLISVNIRYNRELETHVLSIMPMFPLKEQYCY